MKSVKYLPVPRKEYLISITAIGKTSVGKYSGYMKKENSENYSDETVDAKTKRSCLKGRLSD